MRSRSDHWPNICCGGHDRRTDGKPTRNEDPKHEEMQMRIMPVVITADGCDPIPL
jgi:hypothetical protein